MNKNFIRAIFVATAIVAPLAAHADIAISVGIAPPPLPVYVQPPIPGDGYMWTPGYWAWSDDDDDYYWVPGTWVQPPFVGALWTPGYWGWGSGSYFWHGGYWGTQIGYYGGINYGFGYIGIGYQGGYWSHGSLCYNRTVNNFGGTHVTNIYNTTVVNNTNVTRVSYNGGAGGVRMEPNREQKGASFTHYAPTNAQMRQEQFAHAQPQMHTSNNAGVPARAATQTAGRFNTPNPGVPRSPASQYAPQNTTGQYMQRPSPAQTPTYQQPNTRTAWQAPPRTQYMAPQPAPRPQSYAPPMMARQPQPVSYRAPTFSAPVQRSAPMPQHQGASHGNSHFR